MELYFSEFVDYGVEEQLPWFDVALEVNQSAFVKFKDQPRKAFPLNNQNLNKKMVDFLKKSWIGSVGVETEKERNHKHMINERMRREKEKQSYIELHNLLPNGTKSDKNSIVQMARKTIEELEKYKDELERKKNELEKNYCKQQMDEARIKLRVANPSSGIDSMLEVLKCLTSADSVVKSVHSSFSKHEFSAVLQIETKRGAAEVEKAVQTSLFEVERKFRCPFPEEIQRVLDS